MHVSDMNSLPTPALVTAAKELDQHITKLETEAYRAAGAGLMMRSREITHEAKQCREKRRAVLNLLNHRNRTGDFGDFGDFGASNPRQDTKKADHAEAARAKAEADKQFSAAQAEITRIAVSLAKRLAPEAGLDRSPARIQALYFALSKAGRDIAHTSGALAAKDRTDTTHRAAALASAVKAVLARERQFFEALPSFSELPQKDALNHSHQAFTQVIALLQQQPCTANSRCSGMLREVAKKPRRQISPTKLRSTKKNIMLARGARIPEPYVLRLLAKQIASRCPRPATMPEPLYASFIIEMTKRAAIYAANEQAKGSDLAAVVSTATNAVVTSDLAAIKEEVSTGVTAPAGEQVAETAIAAAAPQILQGAADAGAIPSIPAAPVSAQPQTTPSAQAVDSPTPTVTDAAVLAVFNTASTSAPSAVKPEVKTETSLEIEADIPELDDEKEAILKTPTPFYKRPLFLVVCALAAAGGYIARQRTSSSEIGSRAQTPAE